MPDNLPLHSCEMEEENSGVQSGINGGLCGGTKTSWQASCVRDERGMTILLDLEPQTRTRRWDRAIWSTLPKDALFQSQPLGLSFSPIAFSFSNSCKCSYPFKAIQKTVFFFFAHIFCKSRSKCYCKSLRMEKSEADIRYGLNGLCF